MKNLMFQLIQRNQLSQHLKKYKKQKLLNKMDSETEDSRLQRDQTGQKTNKSS